MSSTPAEGSRFRTPVRAITSTLVNRSSPSLPPASQTYEPLVKSVLRYRLSRVFVQAALLCWAVNTVWAVWHLGGLSELGLGGVLVTPFKFTTLFGGASLWISAVTPIIVLRKLFLTPTRTPSSSPQSTLSSALTKKSTQPALVAYALSSVAVAFLHVYVQTDADGLSVFVKSKKHPQYLNGKFLFLVVSQLVVSLSFLFRNILKDRFAFRWVGMSSRSPSPILEIVVSFFVAVVSTTACIPLASFLFGFGRMVVLPVLYQLPFIPVFLRPFTAHFLLKRGPYTLALPFMHVGLLARAWFVGLTTLFLWESAEVMFEGIISEPVPVTTSSSTPASTITLLVSGITSSDPIMKYFAYAELARVTMGGTASAQAHRQALFGNDSKGGSALWGVFVREALVVLGKDYQVLVRRGAPPPPPAPTSTPKANSGSGFAPFSSTFGSSTTGLPSTPAKKPQDPFGTPLHLLKPTHSILKSSSNRRGMSPVLATFGSDGPLEKAVERVVDAQSVPELFRSVSASTSPSTILSTSQAVSTPTAKPAAAPSPGFTSKLTNALLARVEVVYGMYAPEFVKEEVGRVGRWWRWERVGRRVDVCWVGMREVDRVVLDVLTSLVCASLTEDTYGVVQRDLPKIIEAIVSFLFAVEDAQAELLKGIVPPDAGANTDGGEGADDEEREEREKGSEAVSYVGDALKDSLARIVRTFGDRLTAFRFPPRVAGKVQGFMDFCATTAI
ncbi:hypothetical protein MD484_g3740, partial [Candolleomyces efflorescens]